MKQAFLAFLQADATAEGIVADILPPPNQKRRVTWGEFERES